MNNGDTFVFFSTFIQQVESIKNDKIQLALYKAIANYGSYGELPDFSSIDPMGMLDAVFLPIKMVIDNAKAERQQKQKSGRLGGAPTGNKNASKIKQKQAETTENKQNNLNVNVNVNNKRESEKEKSELSLSRTRKAIADCDERLKAWFEKGNAPYIYKNFEHLVSSDELARLREKYDATLISETILAIENRADLRKKYKNLYRTLLTWLRKEAKNG